MWFFFFLLKLIISTLKRGDNPYQILGIDRDVTEQEIKKAYRKMTLKYHPDVSKDEKSSKIWVKATDAYELLMDSNRRAYYDRTGSVSEEPEQQNFQGFHGGNNDIFNFFFGRFNQQVEYKTEDVNFDRLNSILDEKTDAILFIYNGRDFNSGQFGALFEQVSNEFSEHITFIRSDITNGQEIAHHFQLRSVPTLLYVRKISNDQIEEEKMSGIFRNRDDIINFIKSQWETSITIFETFSKVQKWLKNEPYSIFILEISKSNEPTFESYSLASKYKGIIKFGILIDDYIKAIQYFKLTEFPTFIIISNNKVEFSNSLENAIKNSLENCYFHLTDESIKYGCKKFCLFKVGEPNLSNTIQFVNQPIGWVKKNSKFTKIINSKENDWFIFEPKSFKLFKINSTNIYNSIRRFKLNKLSFEIYKNILFDNDSFINFKSIKKYLLNLIFGLFSNIGQESFIMIFFFFFIFIFLCCRI